MQMGTAPYKGMLLYLLLSVLWASPCRADNVVPSNLPAAEIQALGERMYRHGILPSGEAMSAVIRDDVEVDSTAFSCSSCHLRAGLGSVEGGVVTPPTNGAKLYKPYRRPPSLDDIPDRAGRYIYAKTVPERPAYTRETLANALRYGVDPAGQTFNDIMPRYQLDDADLAVLIEYLERLSSEPSPGATHESVAFATIITDDVSADDRQALLLPLQQFIADRNQQVQLYRDFIKFGYTPTIDMKYAFRQATLDVWEVTGPASTWPAQLEAHYNKRPVFAVLGGISNGPWQPMHDFCESHRLPCLFPITDFPVVSDTGWYTYYFNKGFFQEGEAAARYLNRLTEPSAQPPIIQLVQDSPAGKALAEGFTRTWGELGRGGVTSITLSRKELQDGRSLKHHLPADGRAVVLLWADQGGLPQLPVLLHSPRTSHVFLSANYFGKGAAQIPEEARSRTYLTFPYRLTPFVGSKEGGFDAKVPIETTYSNFGDRRILTRTYTMLQQAVLQGLKLLYDNLYRDHLFDLMSMQMDRIVPDYERISFGPGQRYVSKGTYIIQLGTGPEPALLPRSDWVVH